jgi:hypothetical protein
VAGNRDDTSDRLFREIERDFEALVRLIERAIEYLADDPSAAESLRRAKEAAERGASLAKTNLPRGHP